MEFRAEGYDDIFTAEEAAALSSRINETNQRDTESAAPSHNMMRVFRLSFGLFRRMKKEWRILSLRSATIDRRLGMSDHVPLTKPPLPHR